MTKGKVVLVPFPFDDLSTILKLHRMITVTTRLIRRELGALSSGQQVQVDDGLRRLLEL